MFGVNSYYPQKDPNAMLLDALTRPAPSQQNRRLTVQDLFTETARNKVTAPLFQQSQQLQQRNMNMDMLRQRKSSMGDENARRNQLFDLQMTERKKRGDQEDLDREEAQLAQHEQERKQAEQEGTFKKITGMTKDEYNAHRAKIQIQREQSQSEEDSFKIAEKESALQAKREHDARDQVHQQEVMQLQKERDEAKSEAAKVRAGESAKKAEKDRIYREMTRHEQLSAQTEHAKQLLELQSTDLMKTFTPASKKAYEEAIRSKEEELAKYKQKHADLTNQYNAYDSADLRDKSVYEWMDRNSTNPEDAKGKYDNLTEEQKAMFWKKVSLRK